MNAVSTIHYQINVPITVEEVIAVFESSGINRPTSDLQRIEQMIRKANLTITAWHGEKLIGIARSVTDYSYCCYLSDLAVSHEFQKQGVGKKLVELTKQEVGDQVMLLLLAAPSAMDYYPKIGLKKLENAFAILRRS
jgi:predicted N-acetyltransferase YhbS